MHEKTLLYTALAFTTLAASYGVYKVRNTGGNSTVAITPILLDDASRTVSQAEVPIRLTASDGTGLKLESLRAETAIEDPLALTELHLVFENPEDRVLEGNFRITLPQGASLSRFAMKVGSTWQEGEVVEKQAARQAYEDFLHRRQDPALMEQGAGNEFSARVFPIPAKGKKEIIISYSEVLEAGSPYTLPLRGLPMLGALDVEVHASGSSNATFGVHQTHFTPGQDFVVEGKQLPRSAGLRNGELAIARVVPFAGSRPEPIGSAVILVDTSASRGLGLAEQVKLVAATIAKLPPDTNLSVSCFDQEQVSVFEGKASAYGDGVSKAILARGALGASDVEGAIAHAGAVAKRIKAKRVILIGDGVATAGETDAQKLKDKVGALRAAGVERMDALAVGGIRDDAFLKTVVRGVLDRDGVVLDGKLGADALARRLGESTSSGVPVKVEGAKWSYPEKLDGLQAGDEVIVFAEVAANAPVKVTVGTQTFTPDLKAADRPLVERAWAQAKIQSMIDAPTEDAATTKRKIVALSTKHRVLSPLTAMLVLETDFDYRRFGIDRNANVDILTVENGRVALMHEARDGAEKDQPDTTTATNRNDGVKGKEKADKGGKDDWKNTASERSEQAGKNERKTAGNTETPTTPPVFQGALEQTTTRPSGAAVTADPGARGGDLDRSGTTDGEVVDLLRAPPPEPAQHQRLANGTPPADAPPPPAATAVPTTAPPVGGQVAQPGPGAGGRAATHHAPRRPTPSTGHDEDHFAWDDNQNAPAASASGGHGYFAPREEAAGAQVRSGTLVVQGGISEPEVQRVLRGATPALRACYTNALGATPTLHGRMEAKVVVDALGAVSNVDVTSAPNDLLKTCATTTFKSLRFPAPGTGDAKFTTTFDFVGGGGSTDVAQVAPKASPYEGRFATVMDDLSRGDKDGALDEAKKWQIDQPGDEMALVALGEVYEARGDLKTAARAYGSILELFSFRADSRRFAGERLERLDDPGAIKLAIDTYGKAAEQRPDHPASHRLFAYTLLKHGDYEKAFEAMKKGATRTYPSGRFLGADRILKEDLGIIAAAWSRAEPAKRTDIMSRLHDAGGTEENGPSLRFVLVWETDANDVDFHIYDAHGAHAYYGQKHLASGGDLYADVTTGYGPECFTIRGPADKRTYPYTLQAHYYSRGPMGYGMGKVEIIDHDGKGGLTFEERPFVVMKDRAFVDMGKVERAAGSKGIKTALK